jgi:hypothetical protein
LIFIEYKKLAVFLFCVLQFFLDKSFFFMIFFMQQLLRN